MTSNSRLPNLITLQQVLLILFWLGPWTCSGSSAQTTYEIEVGGNVTFLCPVDKNKEIYFFYLQKGREVKDFVNGYHSNKPIPNTWPNTEMILSNTAVTIYNVNISHTGDYDCIIGYNSQSNTQQDHQKLIVTAPYSKPSVTQSCKEENGDYHCNVTCASHDGYPSKKMQWNVTSQTTTVGNQTWKVLNNSEKSNSSTKLFTITSTANFNCSSGELMFSCSVGNAISDNFPICVHNEPEKTGSLVIAITSVLVMTVLLICGLIWIINIKCKKRRLLFLEGVAVDNGGGTKEENMELTVKNEVNS